MASSGFSRDITGQLSAAVSQALGMVKEYPALAAASSGVAVGLLCLAAAKRTGLLGINKGVGVDVKAMSDAYTDLHTATGTKTEEERKSAYDKLVDAYYTLSTDFYEYGWGESFHFATRFPNEPQHEAIVRHEYALACRLGLKEGMRVLDVGCGVGGPARNIARLTGAHITGISLNQYQVSRATAKAQAAGPGLHGGPLADKLTFVQADFMKLKESKGLQAEIAAKGQFDAAYAIEATCHAPDRVKCFSEVFATLKPGAVFGGYEWVSTANYDPSNAEHKRIMNDIEVGNGLPTIRPASDVEDALRKAGFEVEVIRDLAPTSPLPWFQPFLEPWTMKGFGASKLGIFLTSIFIRGMEACYLAPAGTAQMHRNLTLGARGLVDGGKKNLFTVMLLFVARKPAAK